MTYRLAEDRDHYMTLFIEPQELWAKMGDDITIHMGDHAQRYLDRWNKPDVSFYQSDEYPQLFDVPDLTLWAEFLILNNKAYQALHDTLEPFGEFLPLNCEGLDYYLFNVLTFDKDYNALDEARSEYVMFEGRRAHLKVLAFKEEALTEVLLFRSDYEGYNRVFCNDKFKQLVEAAGLKGLLFKTDLEGLM